ncbi:RNA polymerase sigma factor [Maridesulfovibrio salexigens]|uniref:RNA polymerase, sigma-24 subunit, ECF subfamily n=1 Tax=Maridesulfovibrio salexigens (strain ATCC 14822 / DSM 2638 / NCIMB 8403 / VKM B-1763) TaxID=526222 RepID=C6C082_MARSD|nr:RNA polymerase sigma factor [Maridesulfovibrio salexigens]ACS80953.1 RNA polymerase, sigma-24 subunit, ECF subfamily [Maridesulfovibrio salexigens DSM 2638]
MVKQLVFNEIYDEYYSKIHHYLKGFVGEHEAEEITQIVFEKINKGLDTFKGNSKLSTWIYMIATKTALDKLKSSSFKHSYAGPLAPLQIHLPEIEEIVSKANDNIGSPDRVLIRDEMNDCIREFIDRLPPDYRTVVILNKIEGFTHKEIAEILKISVETAKIRLHRAKAKLKKSLEVGCDFYINERNEFACDRKQATKDLV